MNDSTDISDLVRRISIARTLHHNNRLGTALFLSGATYYDLPFPESERYTRLLVNSEHLQTPQLGCLIIWSKSTGGINRHIVKAGVVIDPSKDVLAVYRHNGRLVLQRNEQDSSTFMMYRQADFSYFRPREREEYVSLS